MEPAKYNEIQESMKSLVHSELYSSDIYKPSVAYTNARCGKGNTIYRIYVNNTDPELAKFLYVHECGHIIFSHCNNMAQRMDKFLISKIAKAYAQVKDYFGEGKCDKFFNLFRGTLLNVVMDFEVNSRLFTKEEMVFIDDRLSILLGLKTKSLWPGDYGFDLGLTWNEYLTLILMDPKKFMKLFRELALNESDSRMKKIKERDQRIQELSQADYESYRNLSDEELERMRKIAEDHNDSDFNIPSGRMNGFSRDSRATVKINFKSYKSMDDLLRKLISIISGKCKKIGTRDLLYNANRRKFNTNVIIPKNMPIEKNCRRGKLYLLIDASGSVDSKVIFDFVKTFQKLKSYFAKSRIVFWDTDLIADIDINEKIPNLYGGGTKIAAGMDYINDQYRISSNDQLVVISDFGDIMKEWKKSLHNIHCHKNAISWCRIDLNENPGFENIIVNETVNNYES